MRRRHWILIAGISVAAVLVISLVPEGGRERLERMPEAALRPPRAEELSRGGADEERHLFGTNNAYYKVRFGTTEAIQDVVGFYEEALAARGWSARNTSAPTSSEVEAHRWERGEYHIRLGFTESQPGDEYLTNFEVLLVERDPP